MQEIKPPTFSREIHATHAPPSGHKLAVGSAPKEELVIRAKRTKVTSVDEIQAAGWWVIGRELVFISKFLRKNNQKRNVGLKMNLNADYRLNTRAVLFTSDATRLLLVHAVATNNRSWET